MRSRSHQVTKLAVVPSNAYVYWSARGPKVELSVVRVEDDYEVAVVKSVGEVDRIRMEPLGCQIGCQVITSDNARLQTMRVF